MKPKLTPVPGRRREELCIIKLGKTEVTAEEKASITDADVVERCCFCSILFITTTKWEPSSIKEGYNLIKSEYNF